MVSDNSIVYAVSFVIFFIQIYLIGKTNWILISTAAMGAIVVMLQTLKKITKQHYICTSLTFIGKESLSVYLIHYFFLPDISVLTDYIPSLTTDFTIQIVVCSIVSIPVLLLSLLVGKLLGNSHYTNYVFLGKK